MLTVDCRHAAAQQQQQAQAAAATHAALLRVATTPRRPPEARLLLHQPHCQKETQESHAAPPVLDIHCTFNLLPDAIMLLAHIVLTQKELGVGQITREITRAGGFTDTY